MAAAYVLVEVVAKDRPAVRAAIAGLVGVRTVHPVTGPIDLIAYVEGAGLRDLEATFAAMRALDGVARTTTCLVFDEG